MSEFPKIELPKGARTFSGEIVLERRGGEMWDELKQWLESFAIQFPLVNDKIKEIEKEYGVDYVE
jgi:hypothetical protein